jgi:hypothetical protein
MSEQTAVVESSATVEALAVDIERGPMVTWTPEQRTEFRRTGTMPEAPKTEATAASPETVKVESSSASEAAKPQESTGKKAAKPHITAEERISQLESTIEKIRKEAGLRKTPQAESSPAPVVQPSQAQSQKEPTPEDVDQDGKPRFKTYEEYTKALARWEVRQELAEEREREQQRSMAKELNAKVSDARTRYENFDEVLQPTVTAIVSDPQVAPVVKQMLNDSEYLPDLMFTIGSKPEELAKFLTMAKESPGKAIRYLALTESLIHEELSGAPKTAPSEEPPAKPQTKAPKPPAEVGGRAASPPDALVSAAAAGDFRAFKAETTRRYLARMKG